MIECPKCNGDGQVEVSDREQCREADCCGGCAHYERCDACDGTGEVESDSLPPCPECGGPMALEDGDRPYLYCHKINCCTAGYDPSAPLTIATAPRTRDLWAEVERLRMAWAEVERLRMAQADREHPLHLTVRMADAFYRGTGRGAAELDAANLAWTEAGCPLEIEVTASDMDRVTAERDAALAEVERLRIERDGLVHAATLHDSVLKRCWKALGPKGWGAEGLSKTIERLVKGHDEARASAAEWEAKWRAEAEHTQLMHKLLTDAEVPHFERGDDTSLEGSPLGKRLAWLVERLRAAQPVASETLALVWTQSSWGSYWLLGGLGCEWFDAPYGACNTGMADQAEGPRCQCDSWKAACQWIAQRARADGHHVPPHPLGWDIEEVPRG